MSLSADDLRHMERALELAQEAAAFASPNPTVGCVLVRGKTVLGEGAHRYELRDHAEIAALKQAASGGHSVRGATAYVTLEPCAHHGRTGPCSEALIAAGVVRCVVATIDPNPLVRGQGLARLRGASVEAVVLDSTSPLAQHARRLNDAFAHFIQHRRPFVTLKAALSVDGKLAPPTSTRTTRSPHWVTGTAARTDAQVLRHACDAILTGIGTVLADDPALTDRTGLRRRRRLLRVILDSRLRTPVESRLLNTAAGDLLTLCADDASSEQETALRERGAEVVRMPSREGRLELRAVLDLLAQRDLTSLLVESGSALNGSLLRAGLVDKLVLYYAEHELGLDALPFAEGLASPYAVQQQLTSTTHATFASDIAAKAEDVRIAGYLHDPWESLTNQEISSAEDKPLLI